MAYQAPKGTRDVIPAESYRWQYVEELIRKTTAKYGFKEIRTPVIEHTELFLRSVGDTTDVVQKEMYTFNDKGGRSITLKPEGTAGTVRMFVEHGLPCSGTSGPKQGGFGSTTSSAWNASARLNPVRTPRSSPWPGTSSPPWVHGI